MLVCPVCERVYPSGAVERCPEDQSLLYAVGDGFERAEPEVRVGATIANKYELLEEMPRRGGAGRTFRAMQSALQRVVELRVLPSNSLTRPTDHARFAREVSTWARLRSEHLVRLFDSGFTETNAPYMVLELIDGGTLGGQLREDGPLAVDTVKVVAEHALRALDAAHAAGVLHRDLSPDALVLGRTADGRPHCRLTGFGLAKHLGDADDDDPTAITMTGQVVGNPAYMAPETILMGILDPRTDLYALGVTLYELLAGRRPCPGESLSEMLAAHVKGVPTPLHELRPDVPDGLRYFIERLIAREPEARYQSAAEGLAALTSDAAGWPEPPPRFAPVVRARDDGYGWWIAGILGGATALAAGIIGAWWWVRG